MSSCTPAHPMWCAVCIGGELVCVCGGVCVLMLIHQCSPAGHRGWWGRSWGGVDRFEVW